MKKYQLNQSKANRLLFSGIILFVVGIILSGFTKSIEGGIPLVISVVGLLLFLLSVAVRPETIWTVEEVLKDSTLQGMKFTLVSSEPFDDGYITKLNFDNGHHSLKIYSRVPLEKLDVNIIIVK